MYMYVCMSVYEVYINMYMYICGCMYVYECMYVYVGMDAYVYSVYRYVQICG